MASPLAPENCFICGYPEADHGGNTKHEFWSNEQAQKDLANEPNISFDVEGSYVAEHRPY